MGTSITLNKAVDGAVLVFCALADHNTTSRIANTHTANMIPPSTTFMFTQPRIDLNIISLSGNQEERQGKNDINRK